MRIQDYIRQFVSDSETRMRPFLLIGQLNKDYISGNQDRKIDGATKVIVEKNYPTSIYMERKQVNRMLSIYLTRNGTLADNKPLPGFKPTPGDLEGTESALEGNKFFAEFLKEINYDYFYKRLIEEADIYPLAFVKTGTDWSKGDLISTGEVNIKMVDGEVKTRIVNKHEGREFMEVVPINECFPDTLRINHGKEMNEFVQRRPLSLNYILKRYGIIAIAEAMNETYVMRDSFSSYTDISENEEYAYVYEYYRKADAEFPDGRYIVMINEIILYDGRLPFINGPNKTRVIPFDVTRLQSVPGFLPGISVYYQIIDIQDAYNALYNRHLEYANRVGIGKKYVWKGSLLDDQMLNTTPGSVTQLTRFGRKPENDSIEPIGAELLGILKSLGEEMLVTAGLSALKVYGESTSNMRTDGVVDKVAESDANKLANAVENMSNTITDIMKKVLYLEQERQIKLIDTLAVAKIDSYVLKYKMKDIDPQEVVIVNREFLMQNDQYIEKKMLQATNMGVYNPQLKMPYRAKLKAIDMIKASYLVDTLDPVEGANWNIIAMEHREVLDGNPIDVQNFELHSMHIQEHELMLMSSSVLKLKKNDKVEYAKIRELMEKHINEHKNFLQKPQQQSVYNNAKAIL